MILKITTDQDSFALGRDKIRFIPSLGMELSSKILDWIDYPHGSVLGNRWHIFIFNWKKLIRIFFKNIFAVWKKNSAGKNLPFFLEKNLRLKEKIVFLRKIAFSRRMFARRMFTRRVFARRTFAKKRVWNLKNIRNTNNMHTIENRVIPP